MTQRWTFVDPIADETWVMPINPNTATSPFVAKNITTAQGADLDSHGIHRTRMFQAPSAPTSWQFGGVIRTKEHHDELLRWAGKANIVRVTDHLQRTFIVLLQKLDVTDRTPTASTSWRMTYTMTALVLSRVA